MASAIGGGIFVAIPQKRKFYIIAHNPNTVDDAKKFLEAGANALEPDVCVSNGKFFISHDHLAGSNPFTPAHSLVTYLQQLHRLVIAEGTRINFAMIMWDFKDPDAPVDINSFLQIVHDNFSVFPECSGIAMSVTVSSNSNIGFLTKYFSQFDNVAVGIDEEDSPKKVSDKFAWRNQLRYSYANGIIVAGIKPAVFGSMLKAKGVQATDKGMKLIYTRAMANSNAMRDYLHVGIDGIIVNIDTVATLKSILGEKDFAPKYELAIKGYNPWTAPPVPTYYAQIHTADVQWEGTDATIRFDLTGTAGTVSTTLNADYKGVLEQDKFDWISLEGGNIGKVTALTATALTSDGDSGWQPILIKVVSNIDSNEAFFNYGPGDRLQKASGPLKRAADAAPAI